MLKREIKYKDFNDNDTSEVFYFNISKIEIIDLEVEYKDGLGAMLEKMVKENDQKQLWEKFKEIVLLAYGEKSEDGKRFIKSDELREAFSQTAAFDALLTEMMTDEEAAAVFMNGVMPKDLAEAVKAQEKAATGMAVSPHTPPTPPTPPSN